MNKQISFKTKPKYQVNNIQALYRAETDPHRGLLQPKHHQTCFYKNQKQTLQEAKNYTSTKTTPNRL